MSTKFLCFPRKKFHFDKMKFWIVIFLFITCESLEKQQWKWLKPYFVTDDLATNTLKVPTTTISYQGSTTAVMLPSDVIKTKRERRFGAWESDLGFPQTVEKVMTGLTDPFNLRNAISVLPDTLITPFCLILILLTSLWNFSVLLFVVVLAFKSMRIVFYVLGKTVVCSLGCVSRNCCRRITARCVQGESTSDICLQTI